MRFTRPCLPGRVLGPLCLGASLTGFPAVSAQVISEVLAENRGGLVDEDGMASDWVEIHNPLSGAVDLGGWRLSDDPAQPAKWVFPSTLLGANQYLVVFASGKNRAVSGQQLHTNFALSSAGETLLLSRADGSLASSLTFPAQFADISYSAALASSRLEPLPEGSQVRWMAALSTPAGGWQNPAYADESWPVAPAGLGFSTGLTGAVLRVDFNERGNLVTHPGFSSFELTSAGGATALQTGPTTRTYGAMAVTVTPVGVAGVDDRLRATPTNAGAFTESELLRDFIFASDTTGNLGMNVGVTGLNPGMRYRVKLWSFDSSSPGNRVSDWNANGETLADDYTFNGSVAPADNNRYTITGEVTADTLGAILLEGRRQPGNTSHAVFLNALEVTPLGLAGAYATDVSAAMAGQTPSLLLRAAFSLPSGTVTSATLRVRYADGFAAWLDGVEVARRNAPAALDWNTTALGARTVNQALAWEDIPLQADVFTPGSHVLAIHALNDLAAGSDFLISPTLVLHTSPAEQPRFHAVPTPGAINGPSSDGVVADTRFSADRGFYDHPVTVAVTCATPGALIRYTLDGSKPSDTVGLVYSTPLVITNTITLRAVASKPGWISTRPDAQTYVFPALVATQPANPPGWPSTWGVDTEVNNNDGAGNGTVPADYEMDPQVNGATLPGYGVTNALRSLPVISLSLDPQGFHSTATGIHSNPLSTGPAWERDCSLEMFQPDGASVFQANAVVQIHGNSSRRPYRMQKHGFRVEFKAADGPGRLNADLFPGSPVKSFNKLVLRGCFTDGWGLVSWDPARYRPDDSVSFRDVWMKESHRELGHTAGHGLFAHLYINGLYWGLYNLTERVGADFMADHLGGAPEDWDVIADFNELKSGNATAWNAAHSLASAGLSTRTAYEAFAAQVDLVNLADYMLLHFFADAEDWPHHNWIAGRNRAAAGSRWTFFTWDQEIVLDNHGINRTGTNNAFTPSAFFQALRANAEFRLLFADRAQRALLNGGPLSLPAARARWQALADSLDVAIVAESARWGDTADATPYGNASSKPVFTREADWLPAVASVRDAYLPSLFAETNSFAILPELRAANLFPAVNAPSFSQHGGLVPNPYPLAITAGAGTVHVTVDGRDPREAWTGTAVGTAITNGVPWMLTQPVTVKARLRSAGGVWSALTEAGFIPGLAATTNRLVISEVHYHPADPHPDAEFIEIWNPTSSVIDLTGVSLANAVTFNFASGTHLPANGRTVVVRDLPAFTNLFGAAAASGVAGTFTGALANGGERLDLLGPDGNDPDSLPDLIDTVTWDDAGPWPAEADGTGPSLVRIRPALSPANPWSWRISAGPATPGASDSLAFSGNALADVDGNQRPDLLDHALPLGRVEAAAVPGGIQLAYSRNLRADDVMVALESSTNGTAWQPAETLPLSREFLASNQVRETRFWIGEGEGRWFRVRVTTAP